MEIMAKKESFITLKDHKENFESTPPMSKIFKKTSLRITIQANLKVVNFLDITLNLNNGKYHPYRKPNDKPVYIHKQCNLPPNIIKNLPDSISRRVSDISHDKEILNQAAPLYEDALKSCSY